MSVIHFELIFVNGVRCTKLHSFASAYSVVPAMFVEETILSSLNGLDILVNNQLIVNVRLYFFDSLFKKNMYLWDGEVRERESIYDSLPPHLLLHYLSACSRS